MGGDHRAVRPPDFADPVPLPGLFDLEGQVAVVTGAGSGIGQACAARLTQAGASVLCADIDGAAAEVTALGLEAVGRTAAGLTSDVREADDAERTVASAIDRWGRVDVVVNAAGVYPPSPALETPVGFWDEVHAINLRGTFLTSQACARRMATGGWGGRIVNLASKSAFQPSKGLAHYASTKSAVVGLTRALALEWAPHGIRVNAVAPGAVDTTGTRRVAEQMITEQPLTADQVRAAHSARCPLGRQAEPDEIARIVLFLATPASSYVTGATIVADGGYMLS
jgi:NAD(P)-dependent dehydrogenase (short-subunit alcohol dehydrogenase family)